jgi:hypothetical protein
MVPEYSGFIHNKFLYFHVDFLGRFLRCINLGDNANIKI